jgi:L-asparaginase II
LYNAALGMARLCDPHDLPEERADACRKIASAMTSHPEMVSADGEFGCELMRVGEGRIVCKRGAEGYQIIGLMPGVLGEGSPGVGIAFKVSDGDASRKDMNLESSVRVRPAVTLEILRQLGVVSSKQEYPDGHLRQALGRFGPVKSIQNHRGIPTGQSRRLFLLVLQRKVTSENA